jgi:uncharacterized protein (TIGR02594 family)
MAGTAQRDVLLIIRAKGTAARAIDATSDALQRLLETQQDVGDGAKSTGADLLKLLGDIKKLEAAYGTIDSAANKADSAFNRQQHKLAGTRAELAAIKSQIEGVGRAIEKAQSDIVDFKLGNPLGGKGGAAIRQVDHAELVEQIKAAEASLRPLQAQEARLAASIRAQEQATGEAKSSLQELGSIANAAEAALVGVGGATAREMLEARLATEQATAALREQARVAREEAAAREAQGRVNSLLGVAERKPGAAASSASVFEDDARATKEAAAAQAELADRARTLMAQANPIAAAQDRVNAELEEARSLYEAGAISAADYATAQQSILDKGAALISKLDGTAETAREAARAEAEMAQKAAVLKAQINPLAHIQDRLNTELREARDLYRAGKISAQELALAERVLAQQAENASNALGRQGRGERGQFGLFGLKPYELTNLGYQVNDLVTQVASGTSITQSLAQQGGQLIQIFPRVGAALLGALTNPAILAGAATLFVVFSAVKKIVGEERRVRTFGGALASISDGSRYNAQALSDTAGKLDKFGMSADEAVLSVRRFIREGLNPELIESFGRAAANAAAVLGGDVAESAAQIAEGFSGSYEAIAHLDDEMNFLTATERDQIRVMFESGRASDARAAAWKRFEQRMDVAAEKARGPWQRAARGLSTAWDSVLSSVGDQPEIQALVELLGALGDASAEIDRANKPAIDTSAIDKQIDALKKKLSSTKDMLRSAILSPEGQGQLIADMVRVEAQIAQMERRRAQIIAKPRDPVDPNSANEQKRLAGIHTEELASLKAIDLEQRLDEARRRGNAARAAAIAGELEYQRVLNQTKDAARAQAARVVAERQENVRSETQQVQSGQALLRIANRYEGYNENNRNQRAVLMEMFRQAGISIDPAKLAWCAAFINAVLAANGLPTAKGAGGQPTTRAADFKSYGTGVALADARPGDIVVLRPQARGTSGHVGLFSGFDAKGDVRLTAGNQSGSKKVSTETFGRNEVVAVRRPGLADQDAAFIAQADQQRLERQQSFNESLAEEAERRSRTVAQATALLKLSGDAYLAEQGRQAIDNAVWNAEQQAKRQALELSKEQRTEIERTAAAEWDALNAREKATRPIEELSRQRDALLESIKTARRAGEDAIGDGLEQDLGTVDDALKQAIVSAVQFWSEIGTPEAEEALLSLGNLRDSIRRSIGELRQAQVDLVQEERQAILGRIATAREAGDTALAAGLEQRLSEVDSRLEKAIDSAVAFHNAFDSPEARTARTNLAGLRDDIRKTQEQLRLDKMNSELGQLQAQRSELQEMIGFYRSIGEMDVASELRAELRGLDADLLKAIDSLEKFWSESTRPEAQATLLNLQNLRNQIIASQSEFRIAAGDIQQAFAGGMVNAVNQWAQALGEGRNAITATWEAARGFAADFIRQLAMMLLQAAALKIAMKIGFGKVANGMNSLLNVAPLVVASQGMKMAGDKVVAGGVAVGLGAGALAVSAASLMAAAQMLLVANSAGSAGVMHTGGIVGSGGTTRSVWPGVFAGAARFHTGGVIGLRPREIPIIAERGEEMLTRDDPRHILNGGGQDGAAGGGDIHLRNVNVFDSADMLSAALSTRMGEKVFINFVRRNGRAIEAAMKTG